VYSFTAYVSSVNVNTMSRRDYITGSLFSAKIYQLLAYGRWFSPGTPASSTTKTGRHDIDEILLKMALNTKNRSKSTD
jgi:hypothetical protein